MTRTICLNMIVKNEAKAIARCLSSIRQHIDCWLIVDTGSTDGTQAAIRGLLAGIPGEIVESPWKNFGHNRTEALLLAAERADYILLSDADMELVVVDESWKRKLTADSYLITQHQAGLSYRNIRLLNARLSGDRQWKFWGATHEFCDSVVPGLNSKECFDGIEFMDYGDGGSKSDKFARDATLLEQELQELQGSADGCTKSPSQAGGSNILLPRTVFYLAQTYRDLGRLSDSNQMYMRRVELGGWEEEVWYSRFQVARLSELLRLDSTTVIDRYLSAFEARPTRAEPLVELARYLRDHKRFSLAYLFARRAIEIRQPNDILFVDTATYDWRALDELAIASFWTGAFGECAHACDKLLASSKLPECQRQRISENRTFALNRLIERDPRSRLRASAPAKTDAVR